MSTRLLTRADVARLLDLGDCIDAVERAFRAHAEGRTVPSGVLGVRVEGGGFHIKTAGLTGSRGYFAAKLNGNFDANPERRGLPRIQGVIVLCDGRTGSPLALMDSVEITVLRTAAATAVAARHLARHDAAVATICGCGVQGRAQLAALARVLPLRRAYAFDCDHGAASRFAAELATDLGIEIVAADDLSAACRASDVCVTCTPSRTPLLGADDVSPGAFVAAVGADSEEKQELAPELLAMASVVVDHLEQCATIGELHHALERGVLARSDVRAELHEVVAGTKPGRRSVEEVVVFDSTGVALEDVAAAALVAERAEAAGAGLVVDLLG